MPFVITCLILIVLISIPLYVMKRHRHRIEVNRIDLSDDEIFSLANSNLPRAQYIQAWHDIAKAIRISPKKLRHSDTICALRGPSAGLPSHIDDIEALFVHCVDPKIATLDELVQALVVDRNKSCGSG